MYMYMYTLNCYRNAAYCKYTARLTSLKSLSLQYLFGKGGREGEGERERERGREGDSVESGGGGGGGGQGEKIKGNSVSYI